jgi:hypothetical protein
MYNIWRWEKEETADWRKLQNEELHYFFSPNIIILMKSRKVRWVGHVESMDKNKCLQSFGWEDLHRLRGGLGAWNGLIWLRMGTSGGLLWKRRWTFGLHKCGRILDQPRGWRLENVVRRPPPPVYALHIQYHCEFIRGYHVQEWVKGRYTLSVGMIARDRNCQSSSLPYLVPAYSW